MHFLAALVVLTTAASACVDVLFVVDSKSEESRRLALEIANGLDEHSLIRRWTIVGNSGRYTPRVVRNNAELISLIRSVGGEYDNFIAVASTEIARRKETFRPFVVLLFSEAAIDESTLAAWKRSSKSPSLHIFRIAASKARKEKGDKDVGSALVPVDAEERAEFQEIVKCGRKPLDEATVPTTRRTAMPFRRVTTTAASISASNLTTSADDAPDGRVKTTTTRPTTSALQRETTTTTIREFRKKTLKSSVFLARTSAKTSTTTARTTTVGRMLATTEKGNLMTKPKTRFIFASPMPATMPTFRTFRPIGIRSTSTRMKTTFTTRKPSSTTSMTTSATLSTFRTFRPATTRKSTTMPASFARATTSSFANRVPPGCVADVLFVIDLSQGTGDKSQQYLDVAASAIGSLPIGRKAVRVGLLSYSGRGRTQTLVHLDKHDNKERLIEEMFRMERGGGTTRTAEALRFAVASFDDVDAKHAARVGVQRVVVVFTDGYSQDEPRDVAADARRRGVRVVAVAVEDPRAAPDLQQLMDIGGDDKNVLISPTGKQLRDGILGNKCPI